MTPRTRKSFGTTHPVETPGLEMQLNDQVFKVRPKMSGLALLRVIKSMDGENEADAADAMFSFLSKAFLTEDRERGMQYLEFSDPPIDLEELQEVIQWLIEEYTGGNPTNPSESSSAGSTTDGSGTTAAPYETASTSPAPKLTDYDSSPSPAASSPSL